VAWGASSRGPPSRVMRIKSKSADKPGSVTALARYGRHSSRRIVADALVPPTRGLDEQPVLPNARPPTWCCSGWRLPRFTRRRSGMTRPGGDSSLWPCSSPSSAALAATYCGRALPGILLCGARTFLWPLDVDSDGLAGFGLRFYARTRGMRPRRRNCLLNAASSRRRGRSTGPSRGRCPPKPPTRCAAGVDSPAH